MDDCFKKVNSVSMLNRSRVFYSEIFGNCFKLFNDSNNYCSNLIVKLMDGSYGFFGFIFFNQKFSRNLYTFHFNIERDLIWKIRFDNLINSKPLKNILSFFLQQSICVWSFDWGVLLANLDRILEGDNIVFGFITNNNRLINTWYGLSLLKKMDKYMISIFKEIRLFLLAFFKWFNILNLSFFDFIFKKVIVVSIK